MMETLQSTGIDILRVWQEYRIEQLYAEAFPDVLTANFTSMSQCHKKGCADPETGERNNHETKPI